MGQAWPFVVPHVYLRGDDWPDWPRRPIMEDCDRPQGVELARRMVDGMRDWSQKRSEQHQPQVTVSAGLATLGLPPKNFPAQELIEAAQRCLSAAELSGGGVVKSIDIY